MHLLKISLFLIVNYIGCQSPGEVEHEWNIKDIKIMTNYLYDIFEKECHEKPKQYYDWPLGFESSNDLEKINEECRDERIDKLIADYLDNVVLASIAISTKNDIEYKFLKTYNTGIGMSYYRYHLFFSKNDNFDVSFLNSDDGEILVSDVEVLEKNWFLVKVKYFG